MPETWDYSKAGQITWVAVVAYDDGEEPWADTIARREFRGARSKGLAKAYVNRTLDALHTTGRNHDPLRFFWGRIERGTYHAESFIHDGYGLVLDATWEPDTEHGEPIGQDAFLGSDGEVTWEQT